MRRQVAVLLLALASAYPLQDLMTSFPVSLTQQYPYVPSFAQFSGYLDIPNSGGKSLHYVFIESQNNPETDPLVLWLNGGPGCSSLDGFFYEHGPFLFYEGTTLQPNPYAWNLNASMIYLEAPAGVGFSVLGDLANNSTNDYITAHDNLMALLQWFDKFPEYANHEFYITGESYGGVYVPTLAYSIVEYNQEVGYSAINLIGIAVGNGVTDWEYDTAPAMFWMGWSHGMFPWSFFTQYQAACANVFSDSCQVQQGIMYSTYMNNINMYNLYGNCTNTIGYAGLEYTPWMHPAAIHSVTENVPCIDSGAANTYLNNATVQEAFHISSDASLPWGICADLNYTTSPSASLWTYPTLISVGLRIFIYSGDVDGSVPFWGTREWIASLDLEMTQDHTSYHDSTGQVAGYSEVYNGLTFVSVKGAGHMVPQYKPEAALQMFRSFLFGVPL
jgi:carboxypeptidase C (cathepsin A)